MNPSPPPPPPYPTGNSSFGSYLPLKIWAFETLPSPLEFPVILLEGYFLEMYTGTGGRQGTSLAECQHKGSEFKPPGSYILFWCKMLSSYRTTHQLQQSDKEWT